MPLFKFVSIATRRYTWRVTAAMTIYIAILVAVDLIVRRAAPTGPLLYLLAVLPALPVIAVFVALGRYLVEESDEYQRVCMVRQILYATGLTLAITTVWGFLSSFTDIAPARHVAVLWFACFGAASCLIRR
jgi:hypothetical protein